MPNMLGGDQHHPAYDPRTRLASNEVLVGNDLYRVIGGRVFVERVDGSGGEVFEYPEEVVEFCGLCDKEG